MLKLKYNKKLKSLSEYDLINKFFLKTIYLVPKITKTSLHFVLNDLISFLKTEEDSILNKKDIVFKSKFFICLFFYFKIFSIIKNKKIKDLKIKNDLENFDFNILSNNETIIFNFLYLIFVENTFNVKYNIKTIFLDKIILIKVSIPIENLLDLSFLLTSFLFLNLKEKQLTFEFIVNNPINSKISQNFIKNLPLLWFI
jgi:hypothetical protein